MKSKNVAILGASNNKDRYSFKAMVMLKDQGHTPILIHPVLKNINELEVFSSLAEIKDNLDTITIYIRPELQSSIKQQIIDSKANRIIFNPGTENEILEKELEKQGKEVIRACTLVMLSTNQF